MSANHDHRLTCADRAREFVWGAREQDFYKEKGFHQPKGVQGRPSSAKRRA